MVMGCIQRVSVFGCVSIFGNLYKEMSFSIISSNLRGLALLRAVLNVTSACFLGNNTTTMSLFIFKEPTGSC